MSIMVEVRVPNLDCEGCATKLRKAIFKLKECNEQIPGEYRPCPNGQYPVEKIRVDSIDIDMETQKVSVRGYGLEEKKVLKAIKRTGKAAEPWPYPVGCTHFASFYQYPNHIISHYYDTSRNVAAPSVHTFFHTPSVYSVAVASDEAVASLFSDDNPHACSIM